MKKDFSIYEFAGILVPSIFFLFFLNLLLQFKYNINLFEFSELGEALIFILISYGLGHLLQGIGNVFEKIVWVIVGGMPTKWLTVKPRFKMKLFDEFEHEKIRQKVFDDFGKKKGKDYGMLVFTKINSKDLADRATIFNSYYSLFRGLSVVSIILFFVTVFFCYFSYSLIPIFIIVLSISRMIRFGKHYAKEVYRVYYMNFNEKE